LNRPQRILSFQKYLVTENKGRTQLLPLLRHLKRQNSSEGVVSGEGYTLAANLFSPQLRLAQLPVVPHPPGVGGRTALASHCLDCFPDIFVTHDSSGMGVGHVYLDVHLQVFFSLLRYQRPAARTGEHVPHGVYARGAVYYNLDGSGDSCRARRSD
jgi:hypothetical protein